MSQGIKKIRIPVRADEMRDAERVKAVLRTYLNKCLDVHADNAAKEQELYDFYEGQQDILTKERPFNSNVNTQAVENHAKRQVDFKVDFLLGDKVQFSHKSNNDSDDLHYFDRFLTDSGFYTEQREFKKDAYMLGVGTSFAMPRTDIISADGEYDEDYNKDTESPFTINAVSPMKNFVVYSSYIGEEPLFCCSIANVTEGDVNDDDIVSEYSITIYSKYFSVGYKSYGSYQQVDFSTETQPFMAQAFPNIPIIEHVFNKERLGIVEVNKSLFNVINSVISNAADAISDTVNRVFIFKNVEVDGDDLNDMLESGAVILKTANPEAPADFATVDLAFNQGDVNTFYEQRVSKAYDIAGVPLASGVTSSGGDTGKARLLGGGWENAYTIIKGDIIGSEKTDFDLLKQLLAICKTVPDTSVDELYASQIEIHYNINPNDDILSKTQSASNLYAIGVPEELILKYTSLSLDPYADAKKWTDNAALKQKAKEKEEIKKEEAIFEREEMASDEKGENQYGSKENEEKRRASGEEEESSFKE